MLAQCLYTCQINAYTYTRLQSTELLKLLLFLLFNHTLFGLKDMASELVHSATSSKLTETDWSKNIHICELVARDHNLAKDVVKAIKKRLGSKRRNGQLYAVMLLEMLMNNIGVPVHMQVTETGILPILVKIVKKKSEHPVRERIFLLLDAAQTSLGGASGRFPQYYSAYYELVSAGVQFPQMPRDIPKPPSGTFFSKKKKNDVPQENRDPPEALDYFVPDPSRVLQKASTSLEILKDVLDAIDTHYPEKAKDEFTLDLVVQCSFQKQRIMHLAVNSLNEIIVAQAVEINEQLERVLLRHDALLDGRFIRSFDDKINNHGQGEEVEEAEQLFRRMQKGKACVQPKDAIDSIKRGLTGQAIPKKLYNRPLIRPVPADTPREAIVTRPSGVGLNQELGAGKQAVIIPPPPAKSVERERFFQETKSDSSSSGLSGRMGSLSVHSRDVSSSHSGSTEFSEL